MTQPSLPRPDDEVFADSLELASPEEQEQFVRKTCAADPLQCQRVLALLKTSWKLADSDSRRSLLDRAGEMFDALAPLEQPQPGDSIGPYRLGRKLGEGGMGLVFLAQQTGAEGSTVAIKLLKPGMDSQRVLARFTLERQVLQQMDHPGITRILDAGIQDNGRPYFAMELVEDAQKISLYCDQQQLGIRARLKLLIEVCLIVQHAHQRGIIHRDLKPSNILISTTHQPPAPKVIDFGIAKALKGNDESNGGVTIAGERMGTPAYMSPEQAMRSAAGIDIRTDVYSLGVLLYELLTSETPFQREGPRKPASAWSSEESWERLIEAPSQRVMKAGGNDPQVFHNRAATADTLCQELHGELDWIAAKALAHDRHDRYQSVAELQRDLENHLRGLPVEAAGPSLGYRVRKFIIRHRGWTTAAATVLLTIIATSVLTTWFAFRAMHAEQETKQHLANVLQMQAELTDERDRAERAMRNAQSLLRVFQVQTVTTRSFSRYLEPLIDANGQPSAALTAAFASDAGTLNLQVLTEPDQRLIVKGDWSWAVESLELPASILDRSSRMGSAEVARIAQLDDPTRQERQLNPKEASGSERTSESPSNLRSEFRPRGSFQTILLEELRKELPAGDPFIAEVLDNCGLHAMRHQSFEQAAIYLREAIEIWRLLPNYKLNLVQSQLFLVECLQQQTASANEALPILQSASQTLATFDPRTEQAEGLRALAAALQTQMPSSPGN